MPNVILLDAFKQRMEFPELKKVVLETYNEWEPDALIVEKRASGAPLIYELRAMGLPVGEFTPSRGNDKIARVNAVSDLFHSGIVWAPAHRWAEEVIEEFAEFPAGSMTILWTALHKHCSAIGRVGLFKPCRMKKKIIDKSFRLRRMSTIKG